MESVEYRIVNKTLVDRIDRRYIIDKCVHIMLRLLKENGIEPPLYIIEGREDFLADTTPGQPVFDEDDNYIGDNGWFKLSFTTKAHKYYMDLSSRVKGVQYRPVILDQKNVDYNVDDEANEKKIIDIYNNNINRIEEELSTIRHFKVIPVLDHTKLTRHSRSKIATILFIVEGTIYDDVKEMNRKAKENNEDKYYVVDKYCHIICDCCGKEIEKDGPIEGWQHQYAKNEFGFSPDITIGGMKYTQYYGTACNKRDLIKKRYCSECFNSLMGNIFDFLEKNGFELENK